LEVLSVRLRSSGNSSELIPNNKSATTITRLNFVRIDQTKIFVVCNFPLAVYIQTKLVDAILCIPSWLTRSQFYARLVAAFVSVAEKSPISFAKAASASRSL
jgi:hypothetical protein